MEHFLFTADLHGNFLQYERVFAEALRRKVDLLILGGDLTPKNPERRTPQHQRDFFEKELFPLIKGFKSKTTADVLLILGNDDFKSNYHFMIDHQPSIGFHLIDHTPFISKQDYYYVGYTYVPYTPFRYKDWERRDLERQTDLSERKDVREDGFISTDAELVPHNINKSMMQYSIETDLRRITKNIPREKLVLVSHAPPHKTATDYTCIKWGMTKFDKFCSFFYPPKYYQHVGSKAVKEFIEAEQPLLTLHGHIHDTVELTGKFPEKIGTSYVVSVGNDNIPDTPYIVLGKIEGSKVELERKLLN